MLKVHTSNMHVDASSATSACRVQHDFCMREQLHRGCSRLCTAHARGMPLPHGLLVRLASNVRQAVLHMRLKHTPEPA